MKLIINLAKKKEAVEAIKEFKIKKVLSKDIKFENVNLIKLNTVFGSVAFSKNDLYVGSSTLYALMQPPGVGNREHNFHGLTPEEIREVLYNLSKSKCVLKSFDNKYIVVSITIASCGDPIIVIIQTKASLILQGKANINKLITMYPKRNIDNFVKNK